MILPYASTLLLSAASPVCVDAPARCPDGSVPAAAAALPAHGVGARIGGPSHLLLQAAQAMPVLQQAPGRCTSPLAQAEPAARPAADGESGAAGDPPVSGDVGQGDPENAEIAFNALTPPGVEKQGEDQGEDAECRAAGQLYDNVIVVEGRTRPPPGDPLVDFNNATFGVSQAVDGAVVAPVAQAYEEDLPSPIRKGLRNFFRNLLEPITALNYLLQLKPGKAFETLGRFALNTTVGFAGLFDVAKREPFNLPYRRNSLGDTLGYYGVGPGPFLVLPLIGATTLRDLVGTTLDQAVLPIAVGAPFNSLVYAVPAYTVNSLEFRIAFDERLKAINDSVDPYTSMRVSYLCQREAHIASLKGKEPPRDCSIEALFGPQAVIPAEGAGDASATAPAAVDATAPAAQTPVDADTVVATPEGPVTSDPEPAVPQSQSPVVPE